MLLSARALEHVSDVNNFDYSTQIHCTEGDAPTIYLQLIDLSQDRVDHGFSPAGRRYVPAAGATLQVVFDHINDTRKVTRVASQPFPQDPSIWAVPLLPTDGLKGTVNLKLTLIEGAKTTRAFVAAFLAVESLSGVV